MSQFAPTPTHGAAYAVAIETVGGTMLIGQCNTQEKYREFRAKLDALRAWSLGQPSYIEQAYRWGIDKVDADLKGRLAVYDNARAVASALEKLPRPG
jgi:hypothetical protein